MKDMYILAAIRDINIARIIAMVDEEPLGAIFEYGELGDLPSFLRDHDKSNNETILRYTIYVYAAHSTFIPAARKLTFI